MPTPKAGEKKSEFIDRCVPVVIRDGTTDDPKQAVAICSAMFDRHEEQLAKRNVADADYVWLDASPFRRSNQFRKDVIRVGKYVHPNTKREIDVSRERLQHWADKFKEFKSKGINVPIYLGHPGPDREPETLGYIDDMFVDGEELFAVHTFPDDDAVKQAKRCRGVSIGVVDEYVDCYGNKWNDVIDHVAVTPVPVIIDQGEFVALSRDDLDVTNHGASAPQNKDESMDWLKEFLGMPDASEDDIKKALQELKAAADKKDDTPNDNGDDNQQLSNDAVAVMREAVGLQLDALQREGKINEACKKSLMLALAGAEDKPNAFCMSHAMSKTESSIASMVIEALRQNEQAPKTGEKTGPQVPDGSTALSRDDDSNDEAKKRDHQRYLNLSAIPKTQRTDEANEWLSRYEAQLNK